jgi:hypothetical protein
MRYAILQDDTRDYVINIRDTDIVYDSDQLILLTDGEVCGKFYRYLPNETPRFLPPLPYHVYTTFQFLLKFTTEERAAMRLLAQTDTNLADFLQLCQSAHQIENIHPMTLQGMNYLVYLNIITEQRKNEILDLNSNIE